MRPGSKVEEEEKADLTVATQFISLYSRTHALQSVGLYIVSFLGGSSSSRGTSHSSHTNCPCVWSFGPWKVEIVK